MGNRKSSFLLLTCHTDEEITDYLQKKAEGGWRLSSVRGNHFRFTRKEYDGRRLCAYSFLALTHETTTEQQLRTVLPQLRREGWDMIAISGPENIMDTRRHAFLYEENPAESYPPRMEDDVRRIRKKSRRRMISNLCISLIYLLLILALFSLDIVRISASTPYIAASFAFSALLFSCLFLSIRALMTRREDRKDHEAYIAKGLYRYLDYSTRMVFITLLLFISFLALDSLYGGAHRGEKVDIGGSRITVYSDEVPLSLSDLGLMSGGEIRTSRLDESRSPVASYLYSYEQYLGEGADPRAYLSCTVYSSPFRFLRALAEKSIVRSALSASSFLSEAVGLETLVSESGREILIRGGDTVLSARAGTPIGQDAAIALSSLLR